MRWKYLQTTDLSDEQLNALGADGWELVTTIYHAREERHEPARVEGGQHYMATGWVNNAFTQFIFKRPVG